MKELGGTGGRGFFQSKDVRKKLSEDENKQGKREEEVRLLNIPVYEKIWNAYEVAADLAES